MSNADRVRVTIAPEAAFGVAEGSGTTFETVRITSESLSFKPEYVESQELRDDRQIADLIRVNAGGAGDIDCELSYGSHDGLLQAVLQSSGWSAESSAAGVTVTVVGSTKVLTRASGDFTALFAVNDFCFIAGFTGADIANNGMRQVTAVTTTTLTLSGKDMTTVGGGGVAVTFVKCAAIQNGITPVSYNIQKEYLDLSSTFHLFTGVDFGSMGVELVPGSINKIRFGCTFKSQLNPGAVTGDGSPDPAPTTSVMNSVRHVTGVTKGGVAFPVTRLQFDVNDNARIRTQIGTEGAVSIGHGKVAITGRLEGYFTAADGSTIDAFLADSPQSLLLILEDAENNAYAIDFPRWKFTLLDTTVKGTNTDVLREMEFSCYLHPTKGYSMKIGRFG